MNSRPHRYSFHGDDTQDNYLFPGTGRTVGSASASPWLERRMFLNADDESTDSDRRQDGSTSDSHGTTSSDLRSSFPDSRSPSSDRPSFLDVPSCPRRIRSSDDRRRSFYSAEERERRRSYYLDDAERAAANSTGYMRRSSSDQRTGAFIRQHTDDESDSYFPTRRFYISESDSDVRLDELLLRSSRTLQRSALAASERRLSQPPVRPRMELYSGSSPRSRSSSDSHSEDDRPGSAYSSCSSVNEIVDRFRDYNRRVRGFSFC